MLDGGDVVECSRGIGICLPSMKITKSAPVQSNLAVKVSALFIFLAIDLTPGVSSFASSYALMILCTPHLWFPKIFNSASSEPIREGLADCGSAVLLVSLDM